MEKASTADFSSVESYQALTFLCSDHFTEDLFRGGGGGGLSWWPGMHGREVVFLVPAARWRPVAGRSRTGW